MAEYYRFGPVAWNIDTARVAVADGRGAALALSPAQVVQAHGWHRLTDATAALLAVDPAHARAVPLGDPAIVVELAPDERLVIDGAHRLYRAWTEQLPVYPAILLDRAAMLECVTTVVGRQFLENLWRSAATAQKAR